MGLVLAIAGAVVLGVVALVLAVLSIPWIVSLAASTEPARRLGVELRPFSAGFPARLHFEVAAGSAGGGEAPERRSPGKVVRPVRSGQPRRARKRRLGRRMLSAAPRLAVRLLSVFRFEGLRVRGRVGLSDPADTGQLFGILLPLSHVLRKPRFSLDLQPDFTGRVFEGEIEASVQIVPIRVVPPALGFGWQVFVGPG